MYTIIVSKKDSAGLNIKQQLIENWNFAETEKEFDNNKIYELNEKDKKFQLITINEFQVYADYIDKIDTELFIFASRHASESGKPCLTTHAPGNWGKAELGGKNNELVPTHATLIKNYLVELQKKKEKKQLNYEVALECTHHGPYLTKPAVFIEIGSTEKEWQDSAAAETIAEIIANSTKLENKNNITALGIGGGHYCTEFTKLSLRQNYAFSHICPKYALQYFDERMLQKAIVATKEPVQEIVIDYKGLGNEKQRILSILENQNLPVKRVRKLLQ